MNRPSYRRTFDVFIHRTGVTLGLVFAVASGCSSISVTTDHDHGANFQSLTTYDWMPGPQKLPDDPRIEDAALDTQIRRAIAQSLDAKGYHRRVSQNPDFYIGYHAAVGKPLAVTTIDSYYGYDVERSWILHPKGDGDSDDGFGTIGGRVYAYSYDQGTLILDIVDPTMKHLMWRSVAKAAINHKPSPEASRTQIEDVVAQMLANFPPESPR